MKMRTVLACLAIAFFVKPGLLNVAVKIKLQKMFKVLKK